MARAHGGIRWLVASVCVLAGLVIPFVVVGLIVGSTAHDSPGSDMAAGLYGVFLGTIAGLVGLVISAVLSVRWLDGSLRHLARWMLLAGLAVPIVIGLALSAVA